MDQTINITGGVTVNVSEVPQRPQKPTIEITPFLKATYLDIDDSLLLFNSKVQKYLKGLSGPLATEMFDRLHATAAEFQVHVSSDYSAQKVAQYAVEMAGLSFALMLQFGGEFTLPNG